MPQIEDMQRALGAARIGPIRSIIRCAAGQHNRSYSVTAARGRYVLRVYQYKTPREFAFELAVLDRLHGLPVPHIIRFGDADWTRVDGRYAILYRYLPGQHLERFSQRQLRQVGRFIARYHRRVVRFRWHGLRHRFYHLPDKRIASLTRSVRRSRVPFQKFLPEIVRRLKRVRPPGTLPNGPIHVDIKPENVLFHRGRLSGVIDFDNAYMGPFVLDLCKSMAWFGTHRGVFSARAAAAVLEGYVHERPLQSRERSSIMPTLEFAFLSHVFVDYWMRAHRYTSARYFSTIIRDLYAGYRDFRRRYEEVERRVKAAVSRA